MLFVELQTIAILTLKLENYISVCPLIQPPPSHTSLRCLIPSNTMKGPIHKIGFMGLITKSKYQNMSNNHYSKNIFSSSSLTQNRIWVFLVKIMFNSVPKDLYFNNDNTLYIKIINKLCYLLILKVKLSRITLLVSSCI